MNIRINGEMLYLPLGRGVFFAYIHDIVRIEAVSNYSKIFLKNGRTVVVAKVLKWFEGKLAGFIRVHRTHLVNRNCISLYINGKGGLVKLRNGELIEVSKRKRADFLVSYRSVA